MKGLGFIPPENYKNEKYVRDFKSKMIFVSGTTSEEEKENLFRNQSNREFLAKKQEEIKNGDIQKKETRTCFQCKTIGHIAKNCPKAIQSKQGVSLKMKEKMVENEPPTKPL